MPDLEIDASLFSDLRGVLAAVIVIILTIIIAKIAGKLIDRWLRKSSEVTKKDPRQYNFFKHLSTGLIYVIGIGVAVYLIPSLRDLSGSILAGAGILAVVIGFASQQAFSNIVSGLFIDIFKPFRIGDRIRIEPDILGIVEDITLRHTIIRTFENKRIIIPNSVISTAVIENANLGDDKICKFMDFSISYDSEIDLAMRIIQEEAIKHPDFHDNRTPGEKKDDEPAVTVRLIGFGDSSVNLRGYVWSKNPSAAFRMGCDLNKSIKERFDREGIEIPFPYRTIIYKKDIEQQKPIPET